MFNKIALTVLSSALLLSLVSAASAAPQLALHGAVAAGQASTSAAATVVPAPSSAALVGLGLVAAGRRRR